MNDINTDTIGLPEKKDARMQAGSPAVSIFEGMEELFHDKVGLYPVKVADAESATADQGRSAK